MAVFKNIKILKPNQALIQTVFPFSLVGWKKIPERFQNSIFTFHIHFQSLTRTPNTPNKTGMIQQPKTHFTFNSEITICMFLFLCKSKGKCSSNYSKKTQDNSPKSYSSVGYCIPN